MLNVVAVNGSPKKEKGRTAMILNPFLQGLKDQGATIDLFYASQLKVKPCSCGRLYCWNEKPGECILQDSMQAIYPKLRNANLLVLATPIYIPLPGDIQNFINRLTPLLEPDIKFREGRTRAHMRDDVLIEKMVLVASGGWWEKENFDTVIRIVEELAAVSSVAFGGAVIRPHSQRMTKGGQLTKDGEEVVSTIRIAAHQLIELGEIRGETLEAIQRPLVSKEAFFQRR